MGRAGAMWLTGSSLKLGLGGWSSGKNCAQPGPGCGLCALGKIRDLISHPRPPHLRIQRPIGNSASPVSFNRVYLRSQYTDQCLLSPSACAGPNSLGGCCPRQEEGYVRVMCSLRSVFHGIPLIIGMLQQKVNLEKERYKSACRVSNLLTARGSSGVDWPSYPRNKSTLSQWRSDVLQ